MEKELIELEQYEIDRLEILYKEYLSTILLDDYERTKKYGISDYFYSFELWYDKCYEEV